MIETRLREIEATLAERYQLLDYLTDVRPATVQTADKPSLVELEEQIRALEDELLELYKMPQELPEAEHELARARLALPHWFTLEMLPLLFPERDLASAEAFVDALLFTGEITADKHRPDRYRLRPATRTSLVEEWELPQRRDELRAHSRRLADFCKEQAITARTPFARSEWREEQLYHLTAADPEEAIRLMQTRIRNAIKNHFDLNQAYCWLRPVEERRELLAELEAELNPAAPWTRILADTRNNLAAHSHWTEEWYRTITYLPTDLVTQLDAFFEAAPDDSTDRPWLLNLYAPGGHGKTALIDWLLAHYALPRRYACARFDYDTLTADRLLEVANQPWHILTHLAQSFNAQRATPSAALERIDELRGDRIGDFALALRESYGEQTIIIFIDTLEVLFEKPRGRQESRYFRDLLEMLRHVRVGDISQGGTIPGYDNLRIVLTGRLDLMARYRSVVDEVLPPGAVCSLRADGFSREEGHQYLLEKRKLDDRPPELIDAILDAAMERTENEGVAEIIPLKLALYADLVRSQPEITAEEVRKTADIDLDYLVRRILKRIHNLDLRWLLRYGVIFRRMDDEAARILLNLIDRVRSGDMTWDDPELDDRPLRDVMDPSRQLADTPRSSLTELLAELDRYSWVYRQAGIIRFHPSVLQPQYKALKNQERVFSDLHQAAFEHYKQRVKATDSLEEAAAFLREAVYHGFFLGKEGARYWREVAKQHANGPGQMVWALVDEATEASSERSKRLLTEADIYGSHLTLARTLFAEKEDPFLKPVERQLHEAEKAARQALNYAYDSKRRAQVGQVLARILLARGAFEQALRTAESCVEDAATFADDRLASAEAQQLLGEALAANGRWEEALHAMQKAYELSRQLHNDAPTPVTESSYASILADRASLVLGSGLWHQAIALLEEGRSLFKETTAGAQTEVSLALAALNYKRGRLAAAENHYSRAHDVGSDKQALRARIGLQQIALLRGQHIDEDELAGNSEVALAAAAARADWVTMERVLRHQEHKVTDADSLTIIDIRLQYYLEVAGHWRQVEAMLKKGEALLDLRPTDPAVARFRVMRRYVESLSELLPTEPHAALAQVSTRLQEVKDLQTPEARVRAKALLLLLRQHASLAFTIDDQAPVYTLYRTSAELALQQVLDLLAENLTPLDQVDVMRTLAMLPGWSSSLVNRVGLAPDERHTLQLLHSALAGEMGVAPTLLAKVATGIDAIFDEKVNRLGEQVLSGKSDWPLYYTSFARLLAAAGRHEAAQAVLVKAPGGLWQEPPLLAPVVLDIAFFKDWKDSVELIDEVVSRFDRQGKQFLGTELLLSASAAALTRVQERQQTLHLTSWLDTLQKRLEEVSPCLATLDLPLLQATLSLRENRPDQAAKALRRAAEVARALGNPAVIETLARAQDQINYFEVSKQTVKVDQHAQRAPELQVTPGYEAGLELFVDVQQVRKEVKVSVNGHSQGKPLPAAGHRTTFSSLGVLPGSQSPGALPTFTEWHRLLLPNIVSDTTAQSVGSFLLQDLLSPPYDKLLLELVHSDVTPRTLYLAVNGPDLVHIPFGLLYMAQAGQWLSTIFHLSYNRPTADTPPLHGPSYLIMPNKVNYESERIVKELFTLYRYELGAPAGSHVLDVSLFAPPLTKTKFPRVGLSQEKKLPQGEVRSLHLLGHFGQLRDRRGAFFELDEGKRYAPDHLAGKLSEFYLSPALIILEQLPTGSAVEDVRGLLLRNAYAASLARLGAWRVLAVGPRYRTSHAQEADFHSLLQPLLLREQVTALALAELLRQAREKSLSTSAFEPNRTLPTALQCQFDLYHSTASANA